MEFSSQNGQEKSQPINCYNLDTKQPLVLKFNAYSMEGRGQPVTITIQKEINEVKNQIYPT